jgi:hypothetical protein
MNDDPIWLRDLPKRGAAMTELTAGLASSLLPEAAGARDLLPGRIKRRRQGGVVRVAPHRLLGATCQVHAPTRGGVGGGDGSVDLLSAVGFYSSVG